MHVQSSCLTNKNLLLFLPFSLPLLPKLPLVVIQKFCYHGNVTSHFFSLLTSQTFTANDKRQFVPRDKVSPGSNVVVYSPLWVGNNESAECHVKLFRTVLSAYFLIWEIVNLNFTFVVYCKRDSKLVNHLQKVSGKMRLKGKRNTASRVVSVENFREKQNICKGSQVFQGGIFQTEIPVPFVKIHL